MKAYKCDVCGEVRDGDGPKAMDVDVKDGYRLHIEVRRQSPVNASRMIGGEICPECQDKIRDVIQSQFGVPEKPKPEE